MNDVFQRMDDINYIPVLTGWNQSFLIKPETEKYTFVSKNSVYKYNKWLVNPYHDEKKWKDIIDTNKIIDNHVIFADSGGLQEITIGGTPKQPEEIIKWQEKYSNIGFALDKIPYIVDKGSWLFDYTNFKKYAQQTKENIDRALKVRTIYDNFKFYAIIQGNHPSNFEEWRKIIDCEGIDGYCCKCSYNDPLLVAKTAYYATTLDKPIHFLGMGNLTKTIILIYAKNYIKHKISFDSSSWDTGAQFRTYLLPFSFGSKIQLLGDGKQSMNFDFCGCEYCKELTDIYNKDNNDNRVGPLMSLHNLKYNISVFNLMFQIYKDKQLIRQVVKDIFKEDTATKILLCFDFLDDAVAKGLQYAESKYPESMFKDNIDKVQKSLFK